MTEAIPGMPSKIDLVKGHESALEALRLPDTMIVTSASNIKVEAVRKALRTLFPQRSFTVIGVKAESGVNEQPVGNETEEGARNRITSAKALRDAETPDVPSAYISIENGLVNLSDAGEELWKDKAVTVLLLPEGESFSGESLESQNVAFPIEAVHAALEKEGGFKTTTVGSVLAEQYAARGVVMDKQDPHTILTDGAVTREDQMINAIFSVFIKAAESKRG